MILILVNIFPTSKGKAIMHWQLSNAAYATLLPKSAAEVKIKFVTIPSSDGTSGGVADVWSSPIQ